MSKYFLWFFLTLWYTDNVVGLECYTSDLEPVILGSATNFTHQLQNCNDYYKGVFHTAGYGGRALSPQIAVNKCFTVLVVTADGNLVVKGCMTYDRCDLMKSSMYRSFESKGLQRKLRRVTCTSCGTDECNKPDSSGL